MTTETESTAVDTAAIRQRLDQAIADALPVAGGRVLSALRALRRELDRTDNQRAATADRPADPLPNGSAGQEFPVLFAHRHESENESSPIRSSLIAVTHKFTDGAGVVPAPTGWVRLKTGSGRTYEGYRAEFCPGDGVVGHAHDVRCVRTQS